MENHSSFSFFFFLAGITVLNKALANNDQSWIRDEEKFASLWIRNMLYMKCELWIVDCEMMCKWNEMKWMDGLNWVFKETLCWREQNGPERTKKPSISKGDWIRWLIYLHFDRRNGQFFPRISCRLCRQILIKCEHSSAFRYSFWVSFIIRYALHMIDIIIRISFFLNIFVFGFLFDQFLFKYIHTLTHIKLIYIRHGHSRRHIHSEDFKFNFHFFVIVVVAGPVYHLWIQLPKRIHSIFCCLSIR